MPYVYVDADEVLSELTDDEVLREAESRGYTLAPTGSDRPDVSSALRMAIVTGNTKVLYELAAQLAECEHLLPPRALGVSE